jgi:methylated-DNA-protein-cysteine methyltransferase-like protein
MNPFTERAVEIIKKIPAGNVMTYGQIAALAGNPRGARQVARILHSLSRKHKLPWHRVVNAKGEISLPDEGCALQKLLLQGEGVEFNDDGCINLTKYQFQPR